jgi:hypothetical protein
MAVVNKHFSVVHFYEANLLARKFESLVDQLCIEFDGIHVSNAALEYVESCDAKGFCPSGKKFLLAKSKNDSDIERGTKRTFMSQTQHGYC